MANSKKPKEIKDSDIQSIVENFLINKKTLKDLKGISDKEMEAVYTAAYNFYNHGKFKEAETVFKGLCQLDNFRIKYWMGLGASQQMLKKYGQAVEAYSYAALLAPTNAQPPFYAAGCLLAKKDYKRTKQALDAVIILSEGSKKPKLKALREEAKNLLELVEKKLKSKKSKKTKGGKK